VDNSLSRFSQSSGLGRPVQFLNSQRSEEALDNSQTANAIKESPRIRHILSVDVEDYFQVEAFSNEVPRRTWGDWPSRVVENTRKILNLFERHDVKGTFFFLGWVANRFPSLVREVQAQGHELACHSHLHRQLHRLTPSQFRDDVVRSRYAIENAAGVKVVGFRAPSFSVTCNTLWALQILAEEHFEYDSSIFPIHHDLYGIPDAPRWVHRRRLPSGRAIWEVPPSTLRIGKVNLPVAGGGYLRLFPLWFTRRAIKTIHQRDGQPIIVYFHPWELDPDQPRLKASWKSRFRHYNGLAKTEGRLQEILSHGSFQPLINLVRRLETFSQSQALSPDDPSSTKELYRRAVS